MNPTDDYQDVLQNIEAAVVAVWKQNPSMSNYVAMAAYDAAIKYYRALANQQTPKPVNLAGLDRKSSRWSKRRANGAQAGPLDRNWAK